MSMKSLNFVIVFLSWLSTAAVAAQPVGPVGPPVARRPGLGGPVALTALSGTLAVVGLTGLALTLDACTVGGRGGSRECSLGLGVGSAVSGIALAGLAGSATWTKRRLARQRAFHRTDGSRVRRGGPVALTVSGGVATVAGMMLAAVAAAECSADTSGSEVCIGLAVGSGVAGALGITGLTGGIFMLRHRRPDAGFVSVAPWVVPQATGGGLSAMGRF